MDDGGDQERDRWADVEALCRFVASDVLASLLVVEVGAAAVLADPGSSTMDMAGVVAGLRGPVGGPYGSACREADVWTVTTVATCVEGALHDLRRAVERQASGSFAAAQLFASSAHACCLQALRAAAASRAGTPEALRWSLVAAGVAPHDARVATEVAVGGDD